MIVTAHRGASSVAPENTISAMAAAVEAGADYAELDVRLASDGQLNAWFHNGFLQPMDTLRDKRHLEKLWDSGQAPWKTW